MFLNVNDDSTLNHTLCCLSCLSDGNKEQVRAVLELGVADKIVVMMTHKEITYRAPAVRTAGNLLTESHELSAVMVQSGIIPALADLLNDPLKALRKEACWSLSNLLADGIKHIDKVFAYENLSIIDRLFNMIKNEEAGVIFIFE